MSWHFSRALAEDYSQATGSDGEQFALLRSMTTPEAYCWRDKTTECLDLFQSGMMCEPSMQDIGEDLLTWFLEDSPARMSALPEQCGAAKESTEKQAGSGKSTCELSTNANLKRFSGRTPETLDHKDLIESFEILPKEGMYAGGELLELPTWAYRTPGNVYGFSLPTPTSRDGKDTKGMALTRKDGKTRTDRLPMLLFSVVRESPGNSVVNMRGLEVRIAGSDYNPELPEWLMMWPIGWTELRPLEMVRYQQWQLSLTALLNRMHNYE